MKTHKFKFNITMLFKVSVSSLQYIWHTLYDETTTQCCHNVSKLKENLAKSLTMFSVIGVVVVANVVDLQFQAATTEMLWSESTWPTLVFVVDRCCGNCCCWSSAAGCHNIRVIVPLMIRPETSTWPMHHCCCCHCFFCGCCCCCCCQPILKLK